MNDTHPSLAVAELMRVLTDLHGLPWEKAWDITQQTLAYTNHTLLPEALEKWSVPLMEKVLPRHMQIIYTINEKFLDEAQNTYHLDEESRRKVSIIEEGYEKQVRMANLCIVGHTLGEWRLQAAQRVAEDFVSAGVCQDLARTSSTIRRMVWLRAAGWCWPIPG